MEVIQPEPATAGVQSSETEVGSVFVSNYPPYSFWTSDSVRSALDALHRPNQDGAPLGLYLHIPFCRKRCKFCYFRVYTDKNRDEVETYLDALAREVSLYSGMEAIQGRPLHFVYFGGGTPSFISAAQLRRLVAGLNESISWEYAKEVTFECEPGTLTEAKLEAIKEIGVTRLSLGIENFDDEILEVNGRAHHSKEIFRTLPWIRDLNFDQLNIDLIAGMLGETWDTWKDSVKKTIDIAADSVTIYQMELPFNTVFTKDLLEGSLGRPVADWETKRAWHEYAFDQLAAAGYEVSSAYTMVKKDKHSEFVYRDSVWHGSHMIGMGVASFSHVNGVHFQNVAVWDHYIRHLADGNLPLDRAFVTTKEERMTREMILQLKLGHIDPKYFAQKFGADILSVFSNAFAELQNLGFLTIHKNEVRLTRRGLLQVDQLLSHFYDPKYRNARYT